VDSKTKGHAPRSPRQRDVAEYIRDEPLTALAIATAAGFILGGGVNRRIGLVMLTIAGRIALRGVTTSLIAGMVTGGHDNPGPDSTTSAGGRHDNGRTEFQKPG